MSRRSRKRLRSGSARSSTTSSRPRTSGCSRATPPAIPFIVVPDVVSSLSRERVVRQASSSVEWASRRSRTRPRGGTRPIGEIGFCFFLGIRLDRLGSLRRSRTRATSCCSRTVASPSWTSGCSSVWTSAVGRARARVSARGRRGRLRVPARAARLAPASCLEPERVNPDYLLAVHQGRDLVVHDRGRGRPADPRHRHRGDDRELRSPARVTSARCAIRHARRAPVRPAGWRC